MARGLPPRNGKTDRELVFFPSTHDETEWSNYFRNRSIAAALARAKQQQDRDAAIAKLRAQAAARSIMNTGSESKVTEHAICGVLATECGNEVVDTFDCNGGGYYDTAADNNGDGFDGNDD